MANFWSFERSDITEKEISVLVGRNFQATSRVNNFGNCGRRPKLSNRDLSLVRKNSTTSYRQIAADFNSKFREYKISRETVRRVLAKKVIESNSVVKKPLLTVKTIGLKVFVKRFHPKFCVPIVQMGGGSLGIWGCMSYGGK
ncbi:hypothetical protein BpHYR1_009487 [Brachionus plicatilis]|uniref:Transposase Tc1-like domain-containing protein n=1 Tax=Brachionus plicatilis TaxID=10195 RepID=A0A3M7RZX2_BRAPC|nr:hypothetical protein BpHYR1_009487 [Brachionus plicatilis]